MNAGTPTAPEKLRNAFARLRNSILCGRDTPAASAREVIGWWESRRPAYNLIVGSAGVLTCIVAAIVGAGNAILYGGDFGLPDPPLFALFAIVLYGIAANVCYTAGWISELLIRAVPRRHADRFATLNFTLGLIFSVVLTLTPGIVMAAAGIFGLIAHIFGLPHVSGNAGN